MTRVMLLKLPALTQSRVTCCLRAAKESFGGMRLLRRADFNAGANINTFWRMPCRGALEAGSRKAMTWDNKHITWFGTPGFLSFKNLRRHSFLQSSALFIPVPIATLDGGVGLLLPMQEKTYRRLLMLQNALTTMLSHHAGLNPKAFRCVCDARRSPLAILFLTLPFVPSECCTATGEVCRTR